MKRTEVYIAAATLAAHAHNPEGFRQRDVSFLFGLCSNWTENVIGAQRPQWSNTQFLRYLEQLCSTGLAKCLRRWKQPRYRLTRLGLIELLSRMINRREALPPDQFLFLYYFVTTYRERLLELVQAEGREFPTAVRLELKALLDGDALLSEELRRLKRDLQKIDTRISDAKKSSALTSELASQGASIEEIAKEVEQRYPYELNSQKPLRELLRGLPSDVARWELEVGSQRRSGLLWSPARDLLKSYISSLERIARESGT